MSRKENQLNKLGNRIDSIDNRLKKQEDKTKALEERQMKNMLSETKMNGNPMYTQLEVAEEFGVSQSYVSAKCKEWGIRDKKVKRTS